MTAVVSDEASNSPKAHHAVAKYFWKEVVNGVLEEN
jgi:hypothetical protein